jgi:formylglycine-generating enzyme required for sulfatase activity
MPHLPPLRRWPVVLPLSSLVAALALLAPGLAEAPKGKKYALLVGVQRYEHDSLPDLKHAENDVEELSKVLLRSEFRVWVMSSTRGEKRPAARPTASNIRAALKPILDRVTKDDTVLVALAGHGVQLRVEIDGKQREEAFFCPTDAKPRDTRDVKLLGKTMIGLSELFKELEDSGAGVKLLLVDACRNDPRLGRSVDVDSLPRPPRGTVALFSCKSGERAFETDRLGTGHGVFFHYVIEGLKGEARNDKGEVTWARLSEYVIDKVSDQVPVLIGAGARQTPHEIKNLTGKSPVLARPASTQAAGEGKEVTNSIGMKLVRIPAGRFLMGSPADEKDREPNDKGSEAQHAVEITRDFYLGVHEVTQKELRDVMGFNPSHYSADGTGKPREKYEWGKPAGGKDSVKGMSTDDFPVECVSWDHAVEFCRKLSARAAERKAGRKYRLPTEAEWEYACRGEPASYQVFHLGNSLSSRQANFDGNHPYGSAARDVSLGRTCKVGSYRPNRFGLFDMHGNVWEWCADWYGADYYRKSPRRDPHGPSEGSARVFRGGSFSHPSHECRSATRWWGTPAYRGINIGFRVAQVPSDK